MSFSTVVYNNIFKRSSTFALAIMGAAFFFERSFDIATETFFENHNRGKLWKHIEHRYTGE